MKKKTFIVQLIDSKKPNRKSFTQVEDANFYSNDTDASLVFIPHEDTFDFQTAKVVMYNRDDESLVERDAVVTTEDGRNVASYELPAEIISHWGDWTAQPVFISGGEIYSGSIVPFSVFRYLMHERPPRLNEVVTITKFIQQSQALVNEMAQEEAQRVTQEQTRQSAESVRVQAENERSVKYGNYAQQFNDVITDLSEEKDYHSLPEISAARGGHETLGARLDETTTQLAQKVSKGNVNINDFDESTRQTFLEAQGIDVNYVLGDDNVKIENIAFTKKSTNLFNSAEQKENFYMDLYNGKEVSSSSFIASGFIPVEPATEYYIRMVSHVVFYDDKKEYLGEGGSGARVHHVTTTHPNAKYMRISWLKTADPGAIQQVNVGNEQLPFQDYFIKIDKDYVEPREINESDLPDIPIDKLDFVTQKNNLFNKDTVTYNHYVSTESGVLTSATSFVASDFIPIKPSHLYTIWSVRRYAFYDKDKMFISGKPDSTPTNNLVVNAPENAHFIRFSWYPDAINTLENQQINEGSELLPYESFGYVIKNDFLPDSMDTDELIVTLPPKIYGLVGQELNIYFDNIIDAKDKDYDFDVECSIGANFNNYYRVIPSEAGAFDITIKVLKNSVELAATTSKIIVADSGVGNGVNKNVLVIGDSTTAQNGGQVVQKLTDNFSSDVMNITMVGTKGVSPNFHEGKSGWTTKQHYSSEDSSFVYNGLFNFSEFITSNSLTTPDCVILNLGINDMFSFKSDESVLDKATEMVSQYENMITSIKTQNANVIIGIGLTIPPNYSQDAFGFAYKNGQTRSRYKRNNILLVNELIKEFKSRESENIHLVPINTNLDTRYNMGSQEVQVNARNETVITTQVANGGVHPAESGYWQIADVYWYWLKSFEI